jgi:hypothetical protein
VLGLDTRPAVGVECSRQDSIGSTRYAVQPGQVPLDQRRPQLLVAPLEQRGGQVQPEQRQRLMRRPTDGPRIDRSVSEWQYISHWQQRDGISPAALSA